VIQVVRTVPATVSGSAEQALVEVDCGVAVLDRDARETSVNAITRVRGR
jgi:hypothetical protein